MTSDFLLYFKTGWEHIISLDALDHLLFVTALTVAYSVRQWKALLILITAFTIGHSLTLALSVLDLIRFSQPLVEFLIPCTILLAAAMNFLPREGHPEIRRVQYVLALLFGLIHGMGFANTIRFMLASDQTVGWPLFAFNVGLEAGQIVVVALLLSAGWIIQKLKVPEKGWRWIISALAFAEAALMAVQRWPF